MGSTGAAPGKLLPSRPTTNVRSRKKALPAERLSKCTRPGRGPQTPVLISFTIPRRRRSAFAGGRFPEIFSKEPSNSRTSDFAAASAGSLTLSPTFRIRRTKDARAPKERTPAETSGASCSKEFRASLNRPAVSSFPSGSKLRQSRADHALRSRVTQEVRYGKLFSSAENGARFTRPESINLIRPETGYPCSIQSSRARAAFPARDDGAGTPHPKVAGTSKLRQRLRMTGR